MPASRAACSRSLRTTPNVRSRSTRHNAPTTTTAQASVITCIALPGSCGGGVSAPRTAYREPLRPVAAAPAAVALSCPTVITALRRLLLYMITSHGPQVVTHPVLILHCFHTTVPLPIVPHSS